jgi:hypothetical protein
VAARVLNLVRDERIRGIDLLSLLHGDTPSCLQARPASVLLTTALTQAASFRLMPEPHHDRSARPDCRFSMRCNSIARPMVTKASMIWICVSVGREPTRYL